MRLRHFGQAGSQRFDRGGAIAGTEQKDAIECVDQSVTAAFAEFPVKRLAGFIEHPSAFVVGDEHRREHRISSAMTPGEQETAFRFRVELKQLIDQSDLIPEFRVSSRPLCGLLKQGVSPFEVHQLEIRARQVQQHIGIARLPAADFFKAGGRQARLLGTLGHKPLLVHLVH